MKNKVLLVAAMLSALAGAATAHGYKLGDIEVGHLSATPVGKGEIAIVSGPIFNAGKSPVTLAGVSSSIADKAGICTSDDSGKITWVDHVTIEPGGVLAMAKWREHVCLDGVDADAGDGDSLPMTMDFGDAGTIEVEALVGH